MIRSLLICIAFLWLPLPAHATTVLCLGDSLTEGLGVQPSEAWPALLEVDLAKKGKSVKVINAGVSGATSASGPGRMKWHLKGHLSGKDKIDIVILALGANDGLRGLDLKVTKKNLTETITMIKDAHIKILLAAMKMPPNYGTAYTKDFAAMFPEIAKEQHIPMIPFLLEGVGGNPQLNQKDGIHPTAEGHKIVLVNVLKYLEPML